MRILIIEDESMVARRTLRMTKEFYGSKIQSINVCSSLLEGQEFIAQNEIDLLLLDLNLNGEDGFDLLKNMVAQPFHIIIISAYKEKAITAFEYGVLDFVPKPFNETRINQAFQRITQKKENPNSGLKYLAIQKKSRQLLILVTDILYIKGARIYTEIHLANNSVEIHNKSLDKLEQLLPDYFERIHKSYLLDMRQVNEFIVASGGKYSVLLKSGVQLPVSRIRFKELKERWVV